MSFPIKPAGHRVVIKPDPLSEVEQKELERFQSLKSAGFELADVGDNKKRKESHVHTGTVIAVGSQCWIGHAVNVLLHYDELREFGWSDELLRDAAKSWAKVGDRIYFAKYGGYEIEVSGEKYRVMNDEDVTAIITGEVAG